MPIKYTRLTIKHARNQIIYHFPFADSNQWSILFFEKINHVLIYFNIYRALFIEDIKDINYVHRGNKGNNENQWSSCSILIFFTLRWLQSRLQASTFHLFYLLCINHGTYFIYNGTLSITNYQSHLSCGTDWYLPKLLSLFYRYMSYAPRISKISWLKSRIGLVTCAIKDWYLPRLFSLFYRFYRCMLYALKVFKISKMKSRIELVIYTIKDWNLPRLLSFYD